MSGFLTAADAALTWIERVLLGLSMAALAAIAALVCWEIAARSLPAIAIPDGVIMVQMLMVAAIACALGHATATGAHIAVDILFNLMGPGTRRVCEVLALIAALVFMIPTCLWIAAETAEHIGSGRTLYGLLRLPEWPPYAALSLGLISMTLRLVHLLARDLVEGAPPSDDPHASEPS
ncbi:TRAP transporter small permease [Albimonas sp. CAU 1670]|uniref:TRAP transporter small permease n=1 Tax=Albimonas sp. CAU 1670 TaxID=3032599 RepID=UPI0023DA9259|nr:TRAP transporter small permease [Albimonas sp. CAU 1670]MDF2235711.1 TRAP transporter small permease [Albimonas sp. CAU 1670]